MNPELQQIATRLSKEAYESSGTIYHPLPFPEFEHLDTSTKPGSSIRKWNLIKDALPASFAFQSGRVLDIGANAGFYTFNFAQKGAEVDAFEPHEHYASIGQEIAAAAKLPVTWYNKPLEKSDLDDKEYNVALMLSVFQWMSEGNTFLNEATALLRQMAKCSDILFFELGCNHGKSAIQTDQRAIGWIWRLLQDNTAPKSVYYLGSVSAWHRSRRYLFACSKEPLQLTLWQRLVTHALQNGWIG
ncbi:MAG: hypothetical protein CL608_07140 [Anaerolineaceae bacterium]|nr:hypothetical protein [Anaerolineaceae bacterium]